MYSIKARKGAAKLLALQLATGAVLGLLCWVAVGRMAANSALLGCMVGTLTTAWMAQRAFSLHGARQARQIAKRFYRAQAVKFALTALLFGVIFIYVQVNAAVLFVGLIAAQLCYFASPWLFAP